MPSPNSSSATSSFPLSENSTIAPLLNDTHVKWGGGLGTGVSLTFSFPWINGNSAWWQPDYSSKGEQTATYHFGLSSTQMAAVRSALQTWTNVANISFNEVADTSTNVGDFRFAFSSALPSTAWGWSSRPSNYWASAADVWINSTQGSDTGWQAGTSNFASLMHEIGHGLGLKHPGNYNGTDSGTPPFIQASLDFRNYSIMSYNDPANHWYWDSATRTSIYVCPETPMVYDIQAIQYIYGANFSFHTGNDLYTFSPTTPFYKTIWDAGGTDTIDVSNFSLACRISLIPGTYSSVAYYSPDASHFNGENDLGIAFGATIENAIGGSGNDTLIGNDANNSLDGGAGNDSLYGGLGNDIFDWGAANRDGNDIFYGGTGNDIFVLDSVSDMAIEYYGEGTDTIWVSFSYSIGNFPNIENLSGFGLTGVTLTGNAANNYLDGTSGNDIIDGGMGNDTAVYTGNSGNYIITEIAGGSGRYAITSIAEGTDTLTNMEFAQFLDKVVTLSQINVVRDTTPPTISTYSPANSATNIAIGSDVILTFNEAVQRGSGSILLKNAAGIVVANYDAATSSNITVLGSTVTINPTADLSYSTGYKVEFTTGSIKDLAGNNFAGTTAYSFTTVAATPIILNGTQDSDILNGGTGNDRISGGDGNDIIAGGAGSDNLDGGAGFDIAKFSGNLALYTLNKVGTSYIAITKTGTDGTDTLINVESLQFADMTVNLTIQATAAAAPQANVQRLMELYIAFFNRVADADGLAYWIGQMNAGQSINKIADTFYSIGAQYSSLTGFSPTMNNADFINVVYRNVLGRSDGADAGGLTYWNGKLLDGSATRGSLVSTILDAAHGFKGDVTWGWVANLLDNKIAVAKTFAIDWGLGYTSADDSIIHGMAIAKAVTSTDTLAALSLIGVAPIDIHLT